MVDEPHRPEVSAYLAEFGYTPEQIARIMQRLDSFDRRITRDSLFDAIGRGEIDLEAVIREALADPQ